MGRESETHTRPSTKMSFITKGRKPRLLKSVWTMKMLLLGVEVER